MGIEETVKHKLMVISIIIGALSTVTKGLVQGQEDFEIRGAVETISIIEIGYNTEKNPRNLRRFAVTQTIVKNHRLMLM